MCALVERQSEWYQEEVCSIRNVTSTVLGEKVFNTRIFTSAEQQEGWAVLGKSV